MAEHAVVQAGSVPTLLLTEKSRTFQDHQNAFLKARQQLNTKTNSNAIRACKAYGTPNILKFFSSCISVSKCHAHATRCLFWTPSKFINYPRFSFPRTLSFDVSRTFQDQTYFAGLSRSWKIKGEKSRTFREAWEPCPTSSTRPGSEGNMAWPPSIIRPTMPVDWSFLERIGLVTPRPPQTDI